MICSQRLSPHYLQGVIIYITIVTLKSWVLENFLRLRSFPLSGEGSGWTWGLRRIKSSWQNFQSLLVGSSIIFSRLEVLLAKISADIWNTFLRMNHLENSNIKVLWGWYIIIWMLPSGTFATAPRQVSSGRPAAEVNIVFRWPPAFSLQSSVLMFNLHLPPHWPARYLYYLTISHSREIEILIPRHLHRGLLRRHLHGGGQQGGNSHRGPGHLPQIPDSGDDGADIPLQEPGGCRHAWDSNGGRAGQDQHQGGALREGHDGWPVPQWRYLAFPLLQAPGKCVRGKYWWRRSEKRWSFNF